MVHMQAKGTMEHVLVWESQGRWSVKIIMIDLSTKVVMACVSTKRINVPMLVIGTIHCGYSFKNPTWQSLSF